MSVDNMDLITLRERNIDAISLAPGQESLANLAVHLLANIQTKIQRLQEEGHTVDIFGPEWARTNPTEAGQLHADMIVYTYGSTYALPNKDPQKNEEAIREGNLDIYLLQVDGEVVGTTCLVNDGDGRAELGRSASKGRVGNSIIQDLRVLDWLVKPESAEKYHTLYSTLRNAPNRLIDDGDEPFDMPGGQGVTAHWNDFPSLIVNGFGPLYLKHGELEQFSLATLTRRELAPKTPLFIAAGLDIELVNAWHTHYGLEQPQINPESGETVTTELLFDAHFPPEESGVTHLVHADIIVSEAGDLITDAIRKAELAKSPFTQIVLPINVDTRKTQEQLAQMGFVVFGYNPAYTEAPPSLLFGKVSEGVSVVTTFWHKEDTPNPLWRTSELQEAALRIEKRWKQQDPKS